MSYLVLGEEGWDGKGDNKLGMKARNSERKRG